MTVTMVAGHLKAFDLGKWISIDEGGFWVTRELTYYSVGYAGIRRKPSAMLSLEDGRVTPVARVVGVYDYIQITAATPDGKLPPHLAGIRPVEDTVKHGDLDPANF